MHEALGSTPSIKKKSIAKLDFLYRFTWGKILHPPCLSFLKTKGTESMQAKR